MSISRLSRGVLTLEIGGKVFTLRSPTNKIEQETEAASRAFKTSYIEGLEAFLVSWGIVPDDDDRKLFVEQLKQEADEHQMYCPM